MKEPDTNNPAYIDAFSYVKRSRNRQKVILLMATNKKTPTDLVDEMDVRFSLISRTLAELKKKNIVKCINEHEKVGRLYRLTDIGLKIYEELKISKF